MVTNTAATAGTRISARPWSSPPCCSQACTNVESTLVAKTCPACRGLPWKGTLTAPPAAHLFGPLPAPSPSNQSDAQVILPGWRPHSRWNHYVERGAHLHPRLGYALRRHAKDRDLVSSAYGRCLIEDFPGFGRYSWGLHEPRSTTWTYITRGGVFFLTGATIVAFQMPTAR